MTGDGADIIVNATKPRNVGDNLIDAGGGDDNVNLYNGGIQQVEGGVGYDRLVFRTNHVVTFNDVDGSFSDGARETGFEKASIVVGGGSTLLLSTGADLTVAAARGHVVIDRGATADGVAYSL